jgi:hypothetical protein
VSQEVLSTSAVLARRVAEKTRIKQSTKKEKSAIKSDTRIMQETLPEVVPDNGFGSDQAL